MKYTHKPTLGDPSRLEQVFPLVALEIWCCRYWSLQQWECNDMAFPYWRIYWNKNQGGVLTYQGIKIPMEPNCAYIITPYTAFRSHISSLPKLSEGIHVKGREVSPQDQEAILMQNQLLHLFIHFNLGTALDHIAAGIYPIPLNTNIQARLEKLSGFLKNSFSYGKPTEFGNQSTFELHGLINELLSKLPESLWQSVVLDDRIAHVLKTIETNIHRNYTNSELAQKVNMSTNALNRLFKETKGIPLQQFIRKRKMDRAIILLEHTAYSIERIAAILGYANRYHFSRVFKATMHLSPVKLRKGSILKI